MNNNDEWTPQVPSKTTLLEDDGAEAPRMAAETPQPPAAEPLKGGIPTDRPVFHG